MGMFKAILEPVASSQRLRVQVLVKGKWRSVCTNSRNWTEADLAVTCRHLGFTGGEWHHWHEHLNDSTVKQILFQDPSKFQFQSALVLANFDVSRYEMMLHLLNLSFCLQKPMSAVVLSKDPLSRPSIALCNRFLHSTIFSEYCTIQYPFTWMSKVSNTSI